ncbi:ATP synthase F1 subunit delta [Mycoplasma sp. Ms02]|uniref:ATP synthase F1 subunit delta n=1 Tax=Mycoplasma sp. Ms02 TaxID=353851 RepID=UPI001C8AAED0|nr:ATP synthase F1 subunit delta [Mycoplasma sp. Ms02]QZE12435.1 ATP synthase F1 subunit delta [Mycoplasma sp. Ms02]
MQKNTNVEGFAIALFDLAIEQNKLKEVYDNVLEFKEVLKQNPELIDFFKSSFVNFGEKETLIDNICSQYNLTFKNLIKVLIQKNGASYLKEILVKFLKKADEELGILYAKIVVAQELSQNDFLAILAKLEKEYNKKIDLVQEIDPNLISGYKIYIGSDIIQKNILEQLHKIKNHIIAKKGGLDGE